MNISPPTPENATLITRQAHAQLSNAAHRYAYYTLSNPENPELWQQWAQEAKTDWLAAAQQLTTLLGDDIQGHDLGSSGG